MAVIGGGIANHAPFGIAGAVGCADDEFRPSVTVEVVNDKRHIVGSAADVDAHVDAPEQGAVQSVAVEDCRSRESVVGIVVSIGRVPLQDDFVLPVTIDIGYGGVVGSVSKTSAVGGFTA